MPTLTADRIFLGSTELNAVYLGNERVWPPPWTPDQIPDLVAWLDGSKYVPGEWLNKVVGGPEIKTLSNPAPAVSATLLDSKTVIRLKADEGSFRSAWPYPPNDWTLLYLNRFIGPTKGRMFSTNLSPSNVLIGTQISDPDSAYNNGGAVKKGTTWATLGAPGPWQIYGASCQQAAPAGTTFRIDGVQIGGVASAVGATQGLNGGWGLSGYATNGSGETTDFEVAELLLWSRKLTDPERQQAEQYLRDKWGLA